MTGEDRTRIDPKRCGHVMPEGNPCSSGPDEHVHQPTPCENGFPERHHDFTPRVHVHEYRCTCGARP